MHAPQLALLERLESLVAVAQRRTFSRHELWLRAELSMRDRLNYEVGDDVPGGTW